MILAEDFFAAFTPEDTAAAAKLLTLLRELRERRKAAKAAAARSEGGDHAGDAVSSLPREIKRLMEARTWGGVGWILWAGHGTLSIAAIAHRATKCSVGYESCSDDAVKRTRLLSLFCSTSSRNKMTVGRFFLELSIYPVGSLDGYGMNPCDHRCAVLRVIAE